MRNIIALIDYKNSFGSKIFDIPYRSGFDKSLLKEYFNLINYSIDFISFNEITKLSKIPSNSIFLYTSSEDVSYFYKSYIEDVVLYLEKSGYRVIPAYEHLRANNNKVFMQLLLNTHKYQSILPKTLVFGSLEELILCKDELGYPVIIKKSDGMQSMGVYMANNSIELVRKAKSISRTRNIKYEIKDLLRKYRHRGYTLESIYRKKFIVQDFIPGLKNDWKILVFGNKYYVLFRETKKNDFRASGSGIFSFKKDLPEGLLDYAKSIFELFNIPHISLDIGYDGRSFYLFEYQSVYFGTATLEYSNFYFTNINSQWSIIEEKSVLEKVYAYAIADFLQKPS